MAGRPRYDADSYRADVLVLRRRGLSAHEIGRRLGMSRATVYRLLSKDTTE